MKVRNLKQYIEILTKSKNTTPALGSEDDLLLKEYAGKVEKENLDQHIADLSNFATDPRTQIFYELMQNAEDAESQSLHFFLGDHGMLVLNNGRPFLTDSTKTGGQLFEFLFKGKGRKANNPDQIGEHGQGSKLLYTLILPSTYGGDKKEAVRKHLIHDLGGPILFSWQHESDITQLFSWRDQPFEYTGNCEDPYYPLLAKIVLTYYPAEIGEITTLLDGRDEELFSKMEMASMVRFLNNIRSEVIWTDFYRGTLLYIPLGEGQGEEMASTWSDALKQGISVSMDFLKHLQYVYVNGEQIRRSGLHVVQLADLAHGEKPVFLQMAMPKAGAQLEDTTVNFYKFFPIAKSRYGLNYLINTKAYDVGAARQEIDITIGNNKHILKNVSDRIVEYIRQLREDEDREALIQFLRCVLHNKPQGDLFLKEHFHDNLLQAFAENLPTERGFADSAATVRIKKNTLPIRPEDLGISGWEWLDESLYDLYDQIERLLSVSSYTLTGLLEASAANEQYKTWMIGLSDEHYQQLLEGIQTEVEEPSRLQNIRCWRFPNGEVYTLKEISENESLILVLPEIQALEPFLRRDQALLAGCELDCLEDLNQLIKRSVATLPVLMWDRVTSHLAALELLTRDEKWAIFRVYHSNPVAQKHLAGQLSIFLNTKGEKRALGQLSNQTTEWAPSGILDMLTILASEVIPEMQPYFIKKEVVWPYLLNNWQMVETRLSADTGTYKNKLLDLNDIQSANKQSQLLSDSTPWVLLPSGGLAGSAEVFAQEALSSLNAEQYTRLSEFFTSNTELKLVDGNLVPVILDVTFVPLPQSGLSALKSALRENETKIDRTTLEILSKIRNHAEGFSRFFTIQKSDIPTQYTLSKNDGKNIQYYTKDEKLIEFLEQQEGYYLLPRELLNVFEGDTTLRNEQNDDDFILELIGEYKAQRAFIDIVSNKNNPNIKEQYLEGISDINLNSGSEPSTYIGTFEFKAVKIISSYEHWVKKYKNIIKIDGICITDFDYAPEVKIDAEDREYLFSLARLLPAEFGDLSRKLDAVKPKMRGSKFNDLIKVDKYNPLKIVPQIKAPDTYQLAFLLASYQYKSESLTPWSIESVSWENIKKEDALQEFYERKMTFFSNFDLPEGWFNINTAYATTEHELLLEQEKVYPWILEWMNKGDDANRRRQFLTDAGFRDASDRVIQLRRKFRNEESIHEQDLVEAFSADVERLEATLGWIRYRFDVIELKSGRDVSLRKILDYYWTNHNGFPEVVPIVNSGIGSNKLHLQFKSPDWNKVRYITSLADDEEHLWRDVIEREDFAFLYTPDSFGNKFRDGLSREKSISEARLRKSIDIAVNEPKEWVEKVYQAWKAEYSVDLNIFLLDRPVPFLYYFETDNVSVPLDSVDNVKTDRDRDDIYIHQEFPNEDMYKVLSDHQDVLFKKDPDKLVRLLAKKLAVSTEDEGLLTDDQKDKIRNNPESYRRIIDLSQEDVQLLSDNANKIMPLIRDVNIEKLHRLIQETDENTRSQILDHLDLIKTMSDMDLFDILGQLLKKADKEQLEKLVKMWDEIEQELEKEKSKPKPVALIGYIGERLVYWWLEQRSFAPEHVGREVWAYDITMNLNDQPYRIEVKTTIKSVKETDETVPFFLRANQYRYIQSNPDEDYVVVRLSLADLGLTNLYDKYKILGTDLNMILELCSKEIDEYLLRYLNKSYETFRNTRMVFKMNIPGFNQEFWEE